MRFNNLQDCLDWIESCHPSEIELGLERMGQVFQQLQCDFSKTKIVTIAGTNGKGSCVAVLEHLLIQHGYTVGCYTSPHFLRYNERIKINGKEVDDQSLLNAFERIDQMRNETPLTYFEYGTLAALQIFSDVQPDVVILEVGLGGRLDACNIVDADIAIVTNIDIDHVDWLGSDIEVIGREKSGVFRANKIAICGDPQPPASVQQTAERLGAVFYQRENAFSACKQGSSFNFKGVSPTQQTVEIDNIPLAQLPFDSVVAAIQAGLFLGLSVNSDFYQCIKAVSLTGRFQQLNFHGRQLILDVAHNPAAAEHLALKLAASTQKGKTFALVAMMADKDVAEITKPLVPLVDTWYLADLKDNPRALSAHGLQLVLEGQGCNNIAAAKTMKSALQQVVAVMQSDDRLVVFGSFFTVAEVLDLINSYNKKPLSEMINAS